MKLKLEDIQKMVVDAINEVVYVSGFNKKRGTAQLTYQNGTERAKNAQMSNDRLKTDKMEQSNGDTYEVMLKGGITSYNITSIKGTHVMHFFKKYCKKEKEIVKDKEQNEYQLLMKDEEFQKFINTFKQKVGFVIKHYISSHNVDTSQIDKIAIYPVPSSSNFNEEMSKILTHMSMMKFPIVKIDKNILQKNCKNLEKDQDFIDRNQEYYNSPMSKSETLNSPVIDYVDNSIARNNTIKNMQKIVDDINECIRKIITQYNNRNVLLKKGGDVSGRDFLITKTYITYARLYDTIMSNKIFRNIVTDKDQDIREKDILKAIQYTKGPSVKLRTDAIFDIVRNNIKPGELVINGRNYASSDKKLPIQYYEKTPFEIKKLSNGVRMGLRNIYNVTDDKQLLQTELAKTNNSLFVIFDDNVSGGATLADICYQLKNLGIEHIIPITFGQMDESWTSGIIPLTKPNTNNSGGFAL